MKTVALKVYLGVPNIKNQRVEGFGGFNFDEKGVKGVEIHWKFEGRGSKNIKNQGEKSEFFDENDK